MIKAYLASFSSQYEGEDIEVRYRIFEDEELICKETIMMDYKKPAIVAQVALITLLKKLAQYMSKEIVIIINDGALSEIIRETSTTRNEDILKMAKKTRRELAKFNNCLLKDVSGDRVELAKWNEILKP